MSNGQLEDLINEFRASGADLERMNSRDVDLIMDICNAKDFIIWINSMSNMAPVFINNYGLAYYGYEQNDLSAEGFDLYSELIHPDHFADVHRTIAHFTQFPKEALTAPYFVKHQSGEYRWTFSKGKALNFTAAGQPEFVVAIVYDVDSLVNIGPNSSNNGLDPMEEKRYNSLTPREREILHLIASEKTSQEIAGILHIETSTVDTHRKHIIHKLGAKSSIGLVRYALLHTDGSE